MDPLALLERTDKWFLGGGRGALYAPPFPKFLHSIGFWDECYFADLRLPRLFTVLVLDEGAKPLRFHTTVESWRPDRLVLMHRSAGASLRETRCITEQNAWASMLEVLQSKGKLHLFQWGLLEVRSEGHGTPWNSLRDVSVTESTITAEYATAWPAELEPDRTGIEAETISGQGNMLPSLSIHLAFGSSESRRSHTVNLAQRHDESPLYELSLLPQKFLHDELPGDFKFRVGPEPADGLVHMLQHVEASEGSVVTFACGVGLDPQQANLALQDAILPGVEGRCEAEWRTYFAGVPQFASSDPWLTAAYWYRWYGLRLNTVDLEALPIAGKSAFFGPFVTEGIGFFRNFITYSAQAHLREVSWMRDPRLAQGILENLAKCQREDGSFPGHNYSARPSRDFYHADFATGASQFERIHGTLPASALEALERYASYFYRERSFVPGDLYLYSVFDQNETGQEYMSRYQVASEEAEKWGRFKIAGTDATTYMALLCEFLAHHRPGDPPDMPPFESEAEDIRYALGDDAFDREAAFICDVLQSGDLSPARPATGFYPLLLTSMLEWMVSSGEEGAIRTMLNDWLLNPEEFWLPKGFPATAMSDETFSAEGEWKEKRLNCPWNGRSWPMVNSHLVDAIANVARTLDDKALRLKAGEALTKAIRLLFHDGNPARPCCYEHYDPITGTPALYRGYDDYMHSWIVDLILRHAVGVKPGSEEMNPLPLDVEWIECKGIPHPKGTLDVVLRRDANPVVTFHA